MVKVLVVVGTRPEVIKLAPLIATLKKINVFDVFVATTGQHREILEQALDSFDLVSDYDLGVMRPHHTLAQTFSLIVSGVANLLDNLKPEIVVVQGDTTSSIAAGMASFYASVPVAHVEAGLRTHEFQSPFPEEFNRAAVSRLATWHFAPTDRARRNLIAEGIPNDRIWVTGNTGIDSLYMALRMLGLDRYSNSRSSVESVLVTVHRRENFGAPLDRILRAILTLAEEFPKIDFTIPLHPNPQSGEKVKLKLNHRRNIQLVAPMDYFAMVRALVSTDIVITDSGGLQEEAPSLGKPTVVLRESTERPELIDSGMGLLVGSDENLIVSSTRRLIIERGFYESLAQGVSPFGSGTASEQISQVLVESMV